MYNVAMKSYRNLQIPTAKNPDKGNGGLLARNVESNNTNLNSMDPQQRVASYVAEIRKVRQGLKNG